MNKEKQTISGIIGKSLEKWGVNLPQGISPEMVDIFLGNDGLWHWHLKPEFIKDEKQREIYQKEKEQWTIKPIE